MAMSHSELNPLGALKAKRFACCSKHQQQHGLEIEEATPKRQERTSQSGGGHKEVRLRGLGCPTKEALGVVDPLEQNQLFLSLSDQWQASSRGSQKQQEHSKSGQQLALEEIGGDSSRTKQE